MSGKHVVLCLLVPALVLAAGSARAGVVSFSIGQHHFADSTVKDTFGGNWSASLRWPMGTNTSIEFLAAEFHNKDKVFGTTYDRYNGFWSFMIDVHPEASLDKEGRDKPFYVGLGAGLVGVDLDPDTASDSLYGFAWQAYAGVNLGRRFFVEAKYINGGQDGLIAGYSLNLGARWHK